MRGGPGRLPVRSMDDATLLRYSRHILLEEFGIEGQARLGAAHALVIGVGGLGSPVALYLAAAGVARITLVDHDCVDLSNLQRQIVHRSANVGQAKVESAAGAMRALNPDVAIEAIARRADDAGLAGLVGAADVVLDCSDNFATRHAVNRACVAQRRPLVAGAAIRFDGQLGVYDVRQSDSPCYACVFPPDSVFEETRCAVLGVFAPVVGTIGTLQAHEALKLMAGLGSALVGSLLMFDGRATRFDTLRVARDPDCPVCSGRGV